MRDRASFGASARRGSARFFNDGRESGFGRQHSFLSDTTKTSSVNNYSQNHRQFATPSSNRGNEVGNKFSSQSAAGDNYWHGAGAGADDAAAARPIPWTTERRSATTGGGGGSRSRWESASGVPAGNGVNFSSQPPPLMQSYQNTQSGWWFWHGVAPRESSTPSCNVNNTVLTLCHLCTTYKPRL